MGLKVEIFIVAILSLLMSVYLFFETIPRIKMRKDCDKATKKKQLLLAKILITIGCIGAVFMSILGIFFL
jgi:hypothetical protein